MAPQASACRSGDGGQPAAGAARAADRPARIFTGNGLVSVLAVLLALILGGLLIARTNEDVARTAGYFFARPQDFFSAVWSAASDAYVALFQGSVFNPRGSTGSPDDSPADGNPDHRDPADHRRPRRRPGLPRRPVQHRRAGPDHHRRYPWPPGSASRWHLPVGLHLLLVLLAGVVGGALWGGLVGLLKARTGAHEVIVTIMFNYIALYLLRYLLDHPGIPAPGVDQPDLADPGRSRPCTRRSSATQYRLHLGLHRSPSRPPCSSGGC